MKNKLVLFLTFLLINQTKIFSQEGIYRFDIHWEKPQTISIQEEEILFPKIKNQELDGYKIVFAENKLLVNQSSYSIKINKITTSQLNVEDLTYISKIKPSISPTPSINCKISKSKNQHYLALYAEPYLMENGVTVKMTSIEVELTKQKESTKFSKKDFVSSSVLGSSSARWYKISVTEDGLYKIDKAFLNSIGVNTSSLNPLHINIYGNGGGRLPELNSVFRPDDLVKNAIYVEGETDGEFDDSDYILFYAFGPNKWFLNNGIFQRDMNPYTFESHYFIRIDSQEAPKRIETINSSSLSANQEVTSYDYYIAYEKELRNLVSSGQRFYGEIFDAELTQSFPFSVPNIVSTSPVRFSVSMAANAAGGSARFKIGNNTINTVAFPSSINDFNRFESYFELDNPSSNINLTIEVTRPNPSVLSYLDKIEFNARRNLVFTGNQISFRDLNSVGLGTISNFTVQSLPSSGFIWDITDRMNPKRISGQQVGNNFTFRLETDTLRSFVASNGTQFFTPKFVEAVQSQNLHALDAADLLIVTFPGFVSQANRLADLHRNEGLKVHVATTTQIYNEFSCGNPDPTAIRYFAKMFYDRAEGNPNLQPKNLLLFGDGTYDHRNIVSNQNYVITYQVLHSEDYIASLVTDDYFAMMDDNESIEPNDLMDIGVGRIIVSDLNTAKQQVDKIEYYLKNGIDVNSNLDCCGGNNNSDGTFGDWRLNYVQIADDEDNGQFVEFDAEPLYKMTRENHPEMNGDKIYLDAYTQVSGAGGQRYPDVNEAISNRVHRGALFLNYIGHGGPAGAAQERVITIPQIQEWNNPTKPNVFISATCTFTQFDNPSAVSAGEWMFLNPNHGAIALMTTTRAVYVSVNTVLLKKLYDTIFDRDINMDGMSLGEIMRITKNQTVGGNNKRCFTLIGDPALKLALPKHAIVIDSINGYNPNLYIDTVRALSKMRVYGHIEDRFGNPITNYNGVLSPTIFDKPKKLKTLKQDPKSKELDFNLQRNAMYKGKVSVNNGTFNFDFIVPKDINYSFDFGKISVYAHDRKTDASGENQRFYVGGVDPKGLADNLGPEVELYLNNDDFVNGGLTNETPKLIVKVYDESGINMVGNGIGHDIVAVLDEKTAEPIVLNDYYISNLDTYQSGKVEYTFPRLEPGRHTLDFKIWDVNNNPTDARIEFIVAEKQDIALKHVLNYPNPFTTRTEFMFEHNQVCTGLDVQIQILTVSGKLVKTINQHVKTEGFRAEKIEWNGLDDFGDQLAKGVYIYRLLVRNPEGDQAEKIEKLVLLR